MEIFAYIADGMWLRLSNGVEFKIPTKLGKALLSEGVRIRYQYKRKCQKHVKEHTEYGRVHE